MCEFCVKHGEGKKWYLQAKNYAEDLLSDVRRRRFIADFFADTKDVEEAVERLPKLDGAPPFIRRAIGASVTRRSKKMHFGQVLPIEDIEQIFGFVNNIVRVPCICRHVTLGREVRTCYGVTMGPGGGAFGDLLRDLDSSWLTGPDGSDFEQLSAKEALEAFAGHEKDGLCHSVWTFITPFIGGICNCDRKDCMAVRSTVGHDVKMMFRAEYVAEVNPDICKGCRSCMRVCHFGALEYGVSDRKVRVDPRVCYGCGICRTSCTTDAITLKPRSEQPVAARLW